MLTTSDIITHAIASHKAVARYAECPVVRDYAGVVVKQLEIIAGNIGEPDEQEEWEIEPMPEEIPVTEPDYTPAEEPELVPA